MKILTDKAMKGGGEVNSFDFMGGAEAVGVFVALIAHGLKIIEFFRRRS
jgi:hypothetical protein